MAGQPVSRVTRAADVAELKNRPLPAAGAGAVRIGVDTIDLSRGTLPGITGDPQRPRDAAHVVVDGLSRWRVRPQIARPLPLDEIAAAHRRMDLKRQRGTIGRPN